MIRVNVYKEGKRLHWWSKRRERVLLFESVRNGDSIDGALIGPNDVLSVDIVEVGTRPVDYLWFTVE